MKVLEMCDASVVKKDSGFFVKYPNYFDRSPLGPFRTIKEAKERYLIQLAEDYFGSSIRDNSREDKIKMGQEIEQNGTEESGNLRESL